jgi:hypothetical protein
MTEPRSAEQIHAEQVAGFRQAIAQAMGASDQQQAEANGWAQAGLPADMNAVTPGSHQHD